MKTDKKPLECLVTGALGVNSWIVPLDEECVFVVDPGTTSYTLDEKVIVDYLNQRKLKLKGILLTHGHFDHIAGTAVLKKAFPDCPIAVHTDDAFMTGANAVAAQTPILEMLGIEALLPTIRSLPEADVKLYDGDDLTRAFSTGKTEEDRKLEGWKVIHTPGHTPGSICLYSEEEEALISGDTVFYRTYGRSDFPYGSDYELEKSIKKIADSVPHSTLVYPGHEAAGFNLGSNF